MKANPTPTKWSPRLAFILVVLSHTWGWAADDRPGPGTFKIERIQREERDLRTTEGIRKDARCIEATLSADLDIAGKEVEFRAYFYSRDKEMVYFTNVPAEVIERGRDSAFPEIFEKGDDYEVYFEIPESILSGDREWRRVIVVFGQGEYLTARIYPSDDLQEYEFPEKDKVIVP